jgi:hypothetical protein
VNNTFVIRDWKTKPLDPFPLRTRRNLYDAGSDPADSFAFRTQPGIFQAWFALSPSLTSQQVQLVVTVDGVASNAVTIAIR